MKLNRALPIIAAAAIASPAFVARAFTTKSVSSTNQVIAAALPKINPAKTSSSTSSSAWGVSKSLLTRGGNRSREISTTSLSLFDKIFGGGGGGYNAKIDYSAIPFPVPELGQMASDGDAGEELTKNGKTLKLATFAGGCFWGLELFYQRIPGVEYTGVVSICFQMIKLCMMCKISNLPNNANNWKSYFSLYQFLRDTHKDQNLNQLMIKYVPVGRNTLKQ